MSKPSRNSKCPCGSGKKFKKCCTLNILENRKIVEWLKVNDPEPPVNYDDMTRKELDDDFTSDILQDRVEEIMDGVILKESKKVQDSGKVTDAYMDLLTARMK